MGKRSDFYIHSHRKSLAEKGKTSTCSHPCCAPASSCTLGGSTLLESVCLHLFGLVTVKQYATPMWRRFFIAGFTLPFFKVYARTKSEWCAHLALIVKFWLCFSCDALLKVLVIPGSFRVFVFLLRSTFCLWSINFLCASSNRIFRVVRRAACSFTATQESVPRVSGCVRNCKLQENRHADL